MEEISTSDLNPGKNPPDDPTSADVRAYFHPSTLVGLRLMKPQPANPPALYAASTSRFTEVRGRLLTRPEPSASSNRTVTPRGLETNRSWGAPSSGNNTPCEQRAGSNDASFNLSPHVPSSPASSADAARTQQGREQWQRQCAISASRASVYVGAQRIWERIQTGVAPKCRIFSGEDDENIEIAMRGNEHVLL